MKNITHYSRFLAFVLTVSLTTTFISCNSREQVDTQERFYHFVRVLADCHTEKPYREFREWLMTDPGSTAYLRELHSNGILGSAAYTHDYALAEAQWKDHEGVWHSIVQVRTEEGFRTYPGTLLDYNMPEPRATEVKTIEIEPFTNDWDTVYVSVSTTGEYTKPHGNPVYEIAAYTVFGDSLCRLDHMFFGEHADETGASMRFAYNPKDWSIKNSIHETIGYILDRDHNLIYIPCIDENEYAGDMYHPYRFNDIIEGFYQNPVVHSPEIGPSLAGYSSLVQNYYAEGLYVRIDRMPDGTFRYASWDEEYMPYRFMRQYFVPDKIIGDGIYDADEQTYVFRDSMYTYHVPEIHGWDSDRPGYPSGSDIIMTRNGKYFRSYHIGGIPY